MRQPKLSYFATRDHKKDIDNFRLQIFIGACFKINNEEIIFHFMLIYNLNNSRCEGIEI